MQATVLFMNHEDPLPHPASRDIQDIKRQMDKLSGVVGNMDDSVKEMVTAFKGNEFGTEGIVVQMKNVMEEQTRLRKRLDELELSTSKKQMYLFAFVATLAMVVGGLVKSAFDYFFKK